MTWSRPFDGSNDPGGQGGHLVKRDTGEYESVGAMVHTFVTPANLSLSAASTTLESWARPEAASLGHQPLRAPVELVGDRESSLGTGFLHVLLTDMRRRWN